MLCRLVPICFLIFGISSFMPFSKLVKNERQSFCLYATNESSLQIKVKSKFNGFLFRKGRDKK